MSLSGMSNLASVMGHESVTIYVGEEKKRYMIHKNLLTKNSQYFDRALNGNFKESEEQSMHLPEESPAAFDLLVTFLYQDRIPTARCSEGIFATKASQATSQVAKAPLSLFSPPTWIDNRGTLFNSYTPHQEPDIATGFGASYNNRFDSICAQQEFRNLSPEELRSADYKEGRSGTAHAETNVAVANLSTLLSQLPTITDGSKGLKTESKLSRPFKPAFPQASGHIPGIPYCRSLAEIAAEEESYQLALLQLCLMAEKFCWPALFNRAMTAYVQGEANFFNRVLVHEHIELIYQRAHGDSPCRSYVADAFVAQLGIKNVENAGYANYMDLICENPAFLEDIFKSLSKHPFIATFSPRTRDKCGYHDHSDGKYCPRDPVLPGGHTQNAFGVPFGGPLHTNQPPTFQPSQFLNPFGTNLQRESPMMDWRAAQPGLPGNDSD